MDKIKIVLAEDHTIVRKGLRSLLEQQPGIEVIAEAADGREAVIAAETYKPDVLLMDFSMPGLNGLEATRQVKQRVPGIKILILTRHANKEYVENILRAGASGYLIKKSAVDELIVAIQAVHRGDYFIDSSVSKIVINGYLSRNPDEAQEVKITPRQREVLQLIAEGRSNREIASTLHISGKTVENHRANLMQILDLHNTAEIIQYAIQKGFISLDD